MDTENWASRRIYGILGGTSEETIRREIGEELNTAVKSLRLHGIFSGNEFYHEYPTGDKVYSALLPYLKLVMLLETL